MTAAESTIRSGTWKRLDGIDLLRGLAIFFVLMNHVNMRLLGAKVPYTKFLPTQLVHVLVWNGQLGVQMFFAVSGFLITSITLRRWGSLSDVSLRDFYLFRLARIAPLLLLLLTILSGLHFARIHNFVVTAKTGDLTERCSRRSPSTSMFWRPDVDTFPEIGTFCGHFPSRRCFISSSP
jgi:peptidoglycan/LPS O-acetylase OafA/YrhL